VWNGNSLYAYCTSQGLELGVCYGYVAGIAQRLQVEGLLCPNEVTAKQAVDVVRFHLKQHPEARDTPSGKLVAEALLKAFPCGSWDR
jgi:hypothetical protein